METPRLIHTTTNDDDNQNESEGTVLWGRSKKEPITTPIGAGQLCRRPIEPPKRRMYDVRHCVESKVFPGHEEVYC